MSKLKSSAAWLSVAGFLRIGTQFLILLSAVQLVGPQAGAAYAIAIAITSPIFALADLSLRNIFLTYRLDLGISTYVIIRLIALFTAGVIALVVGVLTNFPLLLLMLLAAVRSADSLADLALTPVLKNGHVERSAFNIGANALTTLVVTAIAMFLTSSLEAALGASLLVSIAFLILALRDFYSFGRVTEAGDGRQSHPFRETVGVALSGLKTGTAYTVYSFAIQLPIYYLGANGTDAEVLTYTVLAYAPTGLQIIYASITQAVLVNRGWRDAILQPSSTEEIARKKRKFWVSLLSASAIVSALFLPATVYLVEFLGRAYAPIEWWEPLPIAAAIFILPFASVNSMRMMVQNSYGQLLAINLSGLIAGLFVLWLIYDTPSILSAALVLFSTLFCRVFGGWLVAARSERSEE